MLGTLTVARSRALRSGIFMMWFLSRSRLMRGCFRKRETEKVLHGIEKRPRSIAPESMSAKSVFTNARETHFARASSESNLRLR